MLTMDPQASLTVPTNAAGHIVGVAPVALLAAGMVTHSKSSLHSVKPAHIARRRHSQLIFTFC